MSDTVLIVITAIALLIVSIAGHREADRLKFTDKQVIACIYNPAYEGVNAQDSRQLFLQCLADYKER